MLNQGIVSRAKAFCQHLENIDPKSVSGNDICISYLQHLLRHKGYYCRIYSFVIEEALKYSRRPVGDLVFIDYGCGNGLLGIMAAWMGMRTYLVDIDPDFAEAANNLSKQMKMPLAGVMQGQIDSVEHLKADIIAGTDVIEHIYDLDNFFAIIQKMNPRITTVFSTSANANNNLQVRKLRKIQRADERYGFAANAYSNGNESFLKMRKEIIGNRFNLPSEKVELLAELTRGLYLPDILRAVETYLITGILPKVNPQDTNTCHPYTGSWTERIITFQDYYKLYDKFNFQLRIQPGFYNSYSGMPRVVVNGVLNLILHLCGSKLSPFITLIGYRK